MSWFWRGSGFRGFLGRLLSPRRHCFRLLGSRCNCFRFSTRWRWRLDTYKILITVKSMSIEMNPPKSFRATEYKTAGSRLKGCNGHKDRSLQHIPSCELPPIFVRKSCQGSQGHNFVPATFPTNSNWFTEIEGTNVPSNYACPFVCTVRERDKSHATK